MTEQHDEPGSPQPPGGPQRTDQPGPSVGKVRDTDGAGHTDARDPEETAPVGTVDTDDDQEVQP